MSKPRRTTLPNVTIKPAGDPVPATEFPKEHGHGTHSTRGYSVEARTTDGIPPRIVDDKAFGDEWQRIEFASSPIIGVAPHSNWDYGLAAAHLYSYEAAEALRWWWLAERGMTGRVFFMTRLVEHTVEFSYRSTAVGEKSVIKP